MTRMLTLTSRSGNHSDDNYLQDLHLVRRPCTNCNKKIVKIVTLPPDISPLEPPRRLGPVRFCPGPADYILRRRAPWPPSRAQAPDAANSYREDGKVRAALP